MSPPFFDNMQRYPECLIQTIGYANNYIADYKDQVPYIVADIAPLLWWKYHNALQILRLAPQDIVLCLMPYSKRSIFFCLLTYVYPHGRGTPRPYSVTMGYAALSMRNV